MSQYSAAMDLALSGDGAKFFWAVRVALPDGDLLLVDGPCDVTFGGHAFVGEDETYGSLKSIEGLEEGADALVSEIVLAFKPPSMAAAGELASPDFQGALVEVWKGVITPATGQVVASPARKFWGTLDVPNAVGDVGELSLTWTVIAETDRFFDADEGIRLSAPFLRSVWAGDAGCDFVTGVQEDLPWGSETRIPASVSTVSTAANASLIAAMGGLRV